MNKLIIKKNSGKVMHIMDDAEWVILKDDRIETSDSVFLDLNKSNCFVLDGEKLPENYNVKTLGYYDGDYIELDEISVLKKEKLYELKELFADVYNTIRWYLDELEIDAEPVPDWLKNRISLVKSKRKQFVQEIKSLTSIAEINEYKLPYSQVEKFKEILRNAG